VSAKNRILEVLADGRLKVQRPDGSIKTARPKAKPAAPVLTHAERMDARKVAVAEGRLALDTRAANREDAIGAAREREQIARAEAAEADKTAALKRLADAEATIRRNAEVAAAMQADAAAARAEAATLRADHARAMAEVVARLDAGGKAHADGIAGLGRSLAAAAEGTRAGSTEQAQATAALRAEVAALRAEIAEARKPKTYTVKHADGTESTGMVR